MPDYKGLTIRFDGDASNLISALREVDAATERTTSMLSRINTALKLEPSNSRLYAMQTQELGRLVDSQKTRLGKLNTALSENKQGYKNATDNVKKYTAAVQRAQENLDAAKAIGDPHAIKAAREELGLAREGLYQATAAQQGFADKIAQTNNDIELGAVKLRQLERAHEDASIKERVQAGTLGDLSFGLKNYGDDLDIIGSKLQRIGGLLTVGGIAGLLTIGRSVISETESYGNAIAQVGGYLDISGQQLEHMSDLALKFGKDTRYSAVEAANAISELAKGGMTQAQIEGGALDATLQLASAGNLDLARAAEVAVQAINVFKLSAEDSSAVADALAGAANRSTAEVDDLAGAFRYVSGWAGLAEYSVNDVSGALGLLADRGLQGEMAGTGLRNVMQRIAAPTDKAKKILEEYGVEVYDAAGEMKPLVELVDELNEAFGNLDDEQRNGVLNDIFGARGLPAAIALMQAGSEELQNYIDATKRVGYAEVMAQAQMGDLGWALEYLRGEFETFQVNLGTAFTPMLVTAAEAAENLLTQFNDMSKADQQAWARGLLEVATLGPKLLVVGTALRGFAAATKGLSVWYEFKAAFAESKTVLGEGATVMQRFGRAAQEASGGTLQAEKAVSLLSTGLYLLGVAAAAYIAIRLWQQYKKEREEEERLNRVVQRSKTFLDDAADAADDMSGAITSSGEAAKTTKERLSELTRELDAFYDEVEDRTREVNATSTALEDAFAVIEKYGGYESITDEDVLARVAGALATINSELGTNYALHSDTGTVIYDENDAVVTLTDSIYRLIEARKAELKAEAYGDLYKEAIENEQRALDAYNAGIDEYLAAKKRMEDDPYGLRPLWEKNADQEIIDSFEGVIAELDAARETTQRMGEAYDQAALDAQKAAESMHNALAEHLNDYDDFEQKVKDAGLSVSDFTGLTEDEFEAMAKAAEGDVDKIIAKLEEWNKKRIEDKYAHIYIEDNAKEVEEHISEAKRKLRELDGTSANIWIRAKQTGSIPAYTRAAGGIRTHAEGGIANYAARYHAGGSIVNVPYTGYPLDWVGEAGAEAIVPLTNRRYSQPFVDLIADGVSRRMGAGTSYNLYINGARVNDDPQIRTQFIDLMTTLQRKGAMNVG